MIILWSMSMALLIPMHKQNHLFNAVDRMEYS